MNTKSFLYSVENKAYRSFYKDGLMDIFFGLLLIGVGLNILRLHMGMDTSRIITTAVILLIPGFILSRYFITRRRLGIANFGEKRKKRKALALLVAVIIQLFFGLLLWISFTGRISQTLSQFQNFINPYTQFILIAIVFSLIGYLIDYNRFYLIGFAAGTGLFLSHAIENNTASVVVVCLSFGLAGVFLTLNGVILLIRFLHEYPDPGQKAEYEKENQS
jgi:hypothetical protein